MYCIKCGAEISPDNNSGYCTQCSQTTEENNAVDTTENNINENPQNTYTTPNDVVSNTPYTPDNQQDQNQGHSDEIEKKSKTTGTISLVLGIVSILTSLACIISIPAGIVGMILGIKTKVKKAAAKIGIALSAVGIAISVFFLIFIIIILSILSGAPKTYYGTDFNLEYDKNWSVVTLEGGQDAFKYKNDEAYLVPIGVSDLASGTSDFSSEEAQYECYQSFYDSWNNDSDTFTIYDGSEGFDMLTDDIYYATYTYGVSSSEIKGIYILLVSIEENAVLSFMTNASEDVDANNERALELLKSIEIFEQESTVTDYDDYDDDDYDVIYDDELHDAMDSMRNWNRYSELRSGDLGTSTSIEGGWRILSDSELYWKFDDGEFWWYESVDNLDDNYWYGTTEILTGKAGLSSVGIDESKMDEIIEQSSSTVTEDDVYTIVCTPTKVISGGEDKSDTNIPSGTTFTYIWIVVDHGYEGIEAQVLNVDTAEASYYVKIAD